MFSSLRRGIKNQRFSAGCYINRVPMSVLVIYRIIASLPPDAFSCKGATDLSLVLGSEEGAAILNPSPSHWTRASHVSHIDPSFAMTLSIFYGAVINPVSLTDFEKLPTCLLAVGPDGTIAWIVKKVPAHLLQDTLAEKGLVDVDVVVLKEGEFIIPGFIDTHTVESNLI